MKPTPSCQSAPAPETITLNEFAARLGRDPRYVAKAIRNGHLPGYWNGERDYDIPALAVERFMRGDWRPASLKVRPVRLSPKRFVRVLDDAS